MERKNKYSGSSSSSLKMRKPERKITEKNRRNNMKFLFSHLFSLIPPHLISKGGDQVSNRVDTTIHYIQSLKANVEMNKKEKEKEKDLLSKKRSYSYQHTKTNVILDIQIHEMGSHLDAVLVTGLKNHSDFCHVIQLLNRYSTEVPLANFSSSGHSIFHLRNKKIEAEEMSKRIKNLIEGSSNMKELELDLGDDNNIDIDGSSSSLNTSMWDFDIESNNIWEWDQLEMLAMSILS